VRYFTEMEHLAPEKFVACGYAATVPLTTNTTPTGRARNRRVEFVFSGHPGNEDG
jgi:flagellar motor protein MotB